MTPARNVRGQGKLIVGLGNPGQQYRYTRHNLGFLLLEALGEKHGASWHNSAANHGLQAKTIIGGIECSLLMPATFMNNSGVSVKKAADKSGIGPGEILVVCDDLTLPFGHLRLRPSGSAGGHNGLRSIIQDLGSDQFARLRMGIDSLKGTVPLKSGEQSPSMVEYVLGQFTPVQKKALPGFINHALDCVTGWVTEGAQTAMNMYNTKREASKEKEK